MDLRLLEIKDAPLMYEWMQDNNLTKYLSKDFSKFSLNDAEKFIINCDKDDLQNVHRAIISDEDEYMGTVSLKHISDGKAEFGIAVRRCALGKGYSIFGMDKILKMAFYNYGLRSVYWCVSENNLRALRFYDKHGFDRIDGNSLRVEQYYNSEQINDYIWYQITDLDYSKRSDT